ncbi:hypothetical protein RRG08_019836 [Elysia crispata]|uniref:Uncharacterized protein n=1 Tax=Elysia crispata TaxID=231223 RepID=A0AAE0ZW72_9GAST|nr:hypothetical protein RRG08_019836 [Elysia crispata]
MFTIPLILSPPPTAPYSPLQPIMTEIEAIIWAVCVLLPCYFPPANKPVSQPLVTTQRFVTPAGWERGLAQCYYKS